MSCLGMMHDYLFDIKQGSGFRLGGVDICRYDA